eukprot:398787-Amphidinium_carterae.3
MVVSVTPPACSRSSAEQNFATSCLQVIDRQEERSHGEASLLLHQGGALKLSVTSRTKLQKLHSKQAVEMKEGQVHDVSVTGPMSVRGM